MTIKIILLSLLLLLLLYAVSQARRSKLLALCMIACCTVGIVFVSAPELSTQIANMLGVGRGADLVIYLLSIVSLFAIFNLHLRLRASHEVTTELARSVAISSARKPE